MGRTVVVCIGICKLNEEQTHCIGCKRTLLELEQWRDYTDEQRKKLAKELKERKLEYAW